MTAAGLAYVLLLGLAGLVTPKGMNFDWFYLFGCALTGWAVGARAALVLISESDSNAGRSLGAKGIDGSQFLFEDIQNKSKAGR